MCPHLEYLFINPEANYNQKINYSFGPRRSGDIEEIYAENQKAKDLLNWEAEISIADAMLDAWNWELKKTE